MSNVPLSDRLLNELSLLPKPGSSKAPTPEWAKQPTPPIPSIITFKNVKGFEEELSRVHLNSSLTLIGRHREFCELACDNGSVSRQHAALVHSEHGLVIVDLQSQQHTFLNDQQLSPSQSYVLLDGDVIRVGSSSRLLRVYMDPSTLPPPPPSSSSTSSSSSSSLSTSNVESSNSSSSVKRRPSSPSSDNRQTKAAKIDPSSSAASASSSAPTRVRARHVLVKHAGSRRPASHRQTGPITRTKEEARAKIESIHRDIIANPSSFMTIADRESDCSSHKRGGDLGFFEFSRMQPSFAAAAFALNIDDISQIVETDSGFHVIQRTG